MNKILLVLCAFAVGFVVGVFLGVTTLVTSWPFAVFTGLCLLLIAGAVVYSERRGDE